MIEYNPWIHVSSWTLRVVFRSPSFAELLPVRAEACRGRRGIVIADVNGLPRLEVDQNHGNFRGI